MDYVLFKKSLVFQCRTDLDNRLQKLESELAALQESAEGETKSSMGDKYETGREMIMQEMIKLQNQRDQIIKKQAFISSIDLGKHYGQVEFGALVVASGSTYFISIPMGIVKIGEQDVFVVSANAPICQAMLGKKAGDHCAFNGKMLSIDEIA